jgi:hypothetical protein
MPPRQLVDHHEANVVARLPVFAPGVSQSDKQLHGSGSRLEAFLTTKATKITARQSRNQSRAVIKILYL